MPDPRARGLLLGYLLDLLLGDPRRGHPVAGFGLVAARLERRMHADSRAAGAVYVTVLVGSTAALGSLADKTVRGRRVLDVAVTAGITWTVLGGASLAREAASVHRHLARGDLPAAREQVTHLVGRDPSGLDPDGVARATVESLAENTSDAVVAPLFWGALAGPAGLLGYRAANTLDAMVGHRSERHLRFGWAAARLDDLLNLAPARLSAMLAAAAAPLVGGRPADALAAWGRDAPAHPSPNAGPVEAGFAGALGVVLGGVNVYAGTVEDRGTLGHGRPVRAADIPRAVRLARVVGLGGVTLAAGATSARHRRRR